jgi:hypothetical protein
MVTKKKIKCNYEHVGSERPYNWLAKWRMRGEEPEQKTVYDIQTHSMRHKNSAQLPHIYITQGKKWVWP